VVEEVGVEGVMLHADDEVKGVRQIVMLGWVLILAVRMLEGCVLYVCRSCEDRRSCSCRCGRRGFFPLKQYAGG